MLKSILISFFVFISIAGLAQDKSLSGIVRDSRNTALSGAVVKLLNTKDSAFVKTTTSSDDGRFKFINLPAGAFRLAITYAGLRRFDTDIITINESHTQVNIPVIILQSGKSEELKAVTVTSKKPLLEYEVDKTVVNVEAMASAAAGNILEVLEKTPGVIVEPAGNIRLNDKNRVLVLIDGRNTYMSAQDLAAYLKSIPGSIVDKIELIENPSAKYDAAGGAVINIRLKKNKSLGLTGNISTGINQGKKTRSNHSLNLNYNHKKINVFTNISLTTDAGFSDDDNDRRYYSNTGELQSRVSINNNFSNRSLSPGARIGLDYTLSSKTIIGFQVNGSFRPQRDKQDFETSSYNSSNDLDSVNTGTMRGKSDWQTVGINANLQHRFNEKGKELYADVNYIRYDATSRQQFDNYKSGSLTNKFSYYLPSGIDIYNFKADYTQPLPNKSSLDAGIKTSLVKNNNNSNYLDQLGKQVYEKSNHFLYNENINAAYVNVRKNGKRLGIQAGLRFENTHMNGQLKDNPAYSGTSFTRDINNLFFTANINYRLDSAGKHIITIGNSRRINRPNYQQFNPFLVFRDNYSYSQGNIDLLPSYLNDVRIQYRYKQWLNLGIGYTRANNIVFPSTEVVGDKYISKSANIGKGRLFAAMVGLNIKPTKWWQSNLNVQVASMKLWTPLYTQQINVESLLARASWYNQFTFSKALAGDLSADYRPNDLQPQRKTLSRYRIDAGIQKKVLNTKGTIRLSVQDITRGWVQSDRSINLPRTDEYHRGISDIRRVGFSFSYRFGDEKFARKRRHNDDAADSETQRVQ